MDLTFSTWLPSLGTLGLVALIGGSLLLLVLGIAFAKWGSFWVQAYTSGADVSMVSLIAMSLLGINQRTFVTAKVMGRKAGLDISRRQGGMTTSRLMAHTLASGDVMKVIRAIIAAERAGIALEFDRAAAIDLAGRDVLVAVQASISPRVIRCPLDPDNRGTTLSAVAKNGVELKVIARVTVRTNLDQLIGGATEETIVARVGQGIITAIGSAKSHMDVLAVPALISKSTLERGLDADTAYAIVSIDIANIDVGANIGARLLIDQAAADMRIAQARAEGRRAEAVATTQEMKAFAVGKYAELVLAEACIPTAIAEAFRAGQIHSHSPEKPGGNFPRAWNQQDDKPSDEQHYG